MPEPVRLLLRTTTLSTGLGLFLRSSSLQRREHSDVPFVAGVLVNDSVERRHRVDGGPRLREGSGILHGELVVEGIGGRAREPLDELQSLARPPEVVAVVEIRRLDDERVAFPMTARIAKIATDR